MAISAPTSLIEMLVPLLRFEPVESLVLVALIRGRLVKFALRVNLSDLVDAIGDAVKQLGSVVVEAGAEDVVMVVVSANGASCPPCEAEYREIRDKLAVCLETVKVGVLDAFVVDRLSEGGTWWSLDDSGRTGVLGDPRRSDRALEMVVAGQPIYGRREDMSDVVAVHADRAAAVAVEIERLSGRAVDVAEAVEAAAGAVRRTGQGLALSDRELAEIGSSLANVAVRDALIGQVEPALRSAAEAVWALLARVLPSALRVEALSMLAVSSYQQGNGVMAGVAVDAALAEAPEHGLSRLLNYALSVGLPPSVIQGLGRVEV